MAQTTQNASFGPVFVVYAFHPSPSRVFRILQAIYTMKYKLVSIKHKRILKKLTKWLKRRVLRRLSPFLLPAPSILLPIA